MRVLKFGGTSLANHITQITQQLNDGAAVTDYKYDSYGNIIQKTPPANGKGQRMWYDVRKFLLILQ